MGRQQHAGGRLAGPCQVAGHGRKSRLQDHAFPTGKSFEFDWPGAKYDYKIDITTSTDSELVYVYNYINTLNAADMAKVPFQKVLEYENSGNVFFSMNGTPQGEDYYINEVFGVAGLTPEFLRTQLSQFAEALDENEALWNDKLWH